MPLGYHLGDCYGQDGIRSIQAKWGARYLKALYFFHCHKIDIEGSSIYRTSEERSAELDEEQARMNVEEHTWDERRILLCARLLSDDVHRCGAFLPKLALNPKPSLVHPHLCPTSYRPIEGIQPWEWTTHCFDPRAPYTLVGSLSIPLFRFTSFIEIDLIRKPRCSVHLLLHLKREKAVDLSFLTYPTVGDGEGICTSMQVSINVIDSHWMHSDTLLS